MITWNSWLCLHPPAEVGIIGTPINWQLDVIQFVAAAFQFVIHIQCDDHTHIHVNQLGGKIEITFQVGRVCHIDDYIRSFFNDMFAYIKFFRSIG